MASGQPEDNKDQPAGGGLDDDSHLHALCVASYTASPPLGVYSP